METRTKYQAKKPEKEPKKQFHIRLPKELLEWYEQEAEKNNRWISGEMILALEAYRRSRAISRPEAKVLSVREP